jgi:hypothetical protein
MKSTIDELRSAIAVDSQRGSSVDLTIIGFIDRFNEAIVRARLDKVLSMLEFPKIYERYDDISQARFRTFKWLLDESIPLDGTKSSSGRSNTDLHSLSPQLYMKQREEASRLLKHWLRDEGGIFHLYGKPGSGKSVLMKYLREQPQLLEHLKVWAGTSQVALGTFFIWAPGTPSQKRFPGLLRGLLHSLLSNAHELAPIAFPDLWKCTISQHQTQAFLSFTDVQRAFENVLEYTINSSSHKIVLLLDGLDEFDDNQTDLVQTLFQWVERFPLSLKIVVSSREVNIFDQAFNRCPRLRLHEVTMHDIDLLISGRLDHIPEFLQLASPERLIVKARIAHKAEGVFLWVSLVLRVVMDGLLSGDSLSDLLQKLDECPPELEQLFSHLLASIHKSDRIWAFRAVSVAQFLQEISPTFYLLRCIPLGMWSFLGDYSKDQESALKMPVRMFSWEEVPRRRKIARKMIYGRCKGFLEVVKSPAIYGLEPPHEVCAVKLIHRTISEFFRKPEIRDMMQPYIAGFNIPDCQLQTFLAMIKDPASIEFYITCSDEWYGMLPSWLWHYLQHLLLLLVSSDSYDPFRIFRALHALGPIMRQRYLEAGKYFPLEPIPHHEWDSLGLLIASGVHLYEFLDWKLTQEPSMLARLPSYYKELLPRLVFPGAFSAHRVLDRIHPDEPDTRLVRMLSRLLAEGHDWNKPMNDWNSYGSNGSVENSDDKQSSL